MVSGLVIVFTVLLAGIIAALLLKTRRIPTGDTTIICGPAGSGKTQLFLKLVGGQAVSTVNSAACNSGTTSHGKKIVDVPGSAKLRGNLFDETFPTARCVILLLNGTELETLHNDIGFILHVVSKCMSRKCPILLLVGKDDLAGEMALVKATSSLDSELQRLTKQYAESDTDVDSDDPTRADILYILKQLDLEDDPTLLSTAAIASRFNLHSLTHNKPWESAGTFKTGSESHRFERSAELSKSAETAHKENSPKTSGTSRWRQKKSFEQKPFAKSETRVYGQGKQWENGTGKKNYGPGEDFERDRFNKSALKDRKKISADSRPLVGDPKRRTRDTDRSGLSTRVSDRSGPTSRTNDGHGMSNLRNRINSKSGMSNSSIRVNSEPVMSNSRNRVSGAPGMSNLRNRASGEPGKSPLRARPDYESNPNIDSKNRRSREVSHSKNHGDYKGYRSDKSGKFKRFSRQRPFSPGDRQEKSMRHTQLFSRVPTKFQLNKSTNMALMDYTRSGAWTDLSLSPTLIEGLSAMKLAAPNPMQLTIVPELLKEKSKVLCASETGSGKTLAYLIPLIEKLKAEELNDPGMRVAASPRAIVLVPSNELVNQVYRVAKLLSHHVKFRVERMSGAEDMEKRRRSGAGSVDMIIANPAQLLFAHQDGLLHLDRVSHISIDEGDTLLSDDFGQQIKELLALFHPELKTVAVCSATIPISLTTLLRDLFPSIVRLGSPKLHMASDRVDMRFIDVQQACEELLAKNPEKRTLIFCNTAAHASRIQRIMSENHNLVDLLNSVPSLLHGSIPERQRQSVLERFQTGDIKHLVTHVIMYDFPRNTVDFIHRAGRTGRLLGTRGTVSCLISQRDEDLARAIKQAIKSQTSLTSAKSVK
ncbi:hypothetical protein PSACC_00373 [Paramicrosporidium saccamoebae]|uniref:Signal recognition particle receptor subunit beta n=1 Tax=Paramicrosporidium saccamoebae TaxID=1246581 RepID=A0A2H9TQ14_9FUNG|nr:hypothetical protein PSACC_00373 [Paramicrosporidium saccamoebae]